MEYQARAPNQRRRTELAASSNAGSVADDLCVDLCSGRRLDGSTSRQLCVLSGKSRADARPLSDALSRRCLVCVPAQR